ncbi:hypothetical protein HMSSN139_01290 [Paenibacillus sp. HMSSN-139]|nr:hypothetical protein HMSSN139_01290 [Paenibacillus sp. HMSSN-139]
MVFNDFKLVAETPVYVQVSNYIKRLMMQGALQAGQRLPSTRELAELLGVSRGSIIAAYEALNEEGLAYAVTGKGNFVAEVAAPGPNTVPEWRMDWRERMNRQARLSVELDHMKRGRPGLRAGKGKILFTSIAPDEQLFDLENVKRAFLDRMAVEGRVLLNYGYAKGYKPLIDFC